MSRVRAPRRRPRRLARRRDLRRLGALHDRQGLTPPARAGASGRDRRTSPDDPASAEDVPETDDRPVRHDWRYVVRTFGKVLIAIGLLLGGFVAYQLWGTGIEAARAQNELEDEFDALLAATSTTAAPLDDDRRCTTCRRARQSTPCRTRWPRPCRPQPRCRRPRRSRRSPRATRSPASRSPRSTSTSSSSPVSRSRTSSAGPATTRTRHCPASSATPPSPATARRTVSRSTTSTSSSPGDEIIVTTLAGRFVYAVTGTEIVGPDDTHVVATTDPDIAELTLTSCHPKYSATQRIIVHSVLVADESAPVGLRRSATHRHRRRPPRVYDRRRPPQPTTTTAVTSTTTTAPASPTTTIALAPDTEPTIPAPAADAFADGWFHDRSAIPQVVFWALVVVGHRRRCPALSAAGSPTATWSASPSASSRS